MIRAHILAASFLFATTISAYEQPCRFAARHIEGGGIGYNQGYTTFEGFFSPDPTLRVMPFFDLRGHIFNNGKAAINAGAGLRTIDHGRVYGLNAYYDYRNTFKRIHYNQIGFGFETLGKRCDARINAYLPFGKRVVSFPAIFSGFSGHSMMLLKKYEFAMRGFNAELGFHFGQSLGRSRFFDLYAGAGPYYFNHTIGSHIWGGKARLGCRFNEYVRLELRNSYDKTFRNRFQCELTISLPFGKGSTKQTDDYQACDREDMLISRMVQPVERQEIIVVDHKKKCSAAIDPTTGAPYNFVFVNNNSHSEGTYESPYPTLALAQANSGVGDIIYVYPGDGTTKGMDMGIALQNNQKFWGSGIDHSIQTAQGTFIIPAQSSSAPMMTSITGDGITVDATNQISGFTIINAMNSGITGINAQNIDISNCSINNSSQDDQIHLEYSGSLPSVITLKNLTLTNGAGNGIFIDSTASSVACMVNNCTIKNNNVFAIDVSCDHQATVSVVNNTIEGINGTSFTFNDTSTLLFSGNTINNTTSVSEVPLAVTAGTKPFTAFVQDNTMSGNTCGSMYFTLNNTDLAQLTVTDNTITNNGTGARASLGSSLVIDPNHTASGNCSLTLTNNTFLNNAGSILYCSQGNFNDFEVTAHGNTMTDNGGAGFVFDNPCNTFGLTATNNTIANGADHGITTTAIIITKATISIDNNQITGNTNSANAIALSHGGVDLNFTVTNNTLSENDSSGIILYSSVAVENLTVNIANNSVMNNQNTGANAAGGIDLEQYGALSGLIANNTLSNNVSGDFYTGSTAVVSPSMCLTMSGNTSNMGYTIANNGAGAYNLAPCDYATINTGSFNLSGTINTVESCPDAVPCS